MINSHPRKSNLFHSISKTLHDLLIGERDASSIYWMLGAITLIGLILRVMKITDPIGYDEAYTFIYFAIKPFHQILSDYSAPNNHILHTILVSISYKVLGGHIWVVRVPAVLAGSLCIPAAYFTARRMFTEIQSLAAAALVALTPWFILYSVNGRGYTLVALLSLLLANLAGALVKQQTRTALIAYGITGALGFYTIPIFLYPMAGISLWVLITHLTNNEPWNIRSRKVVEFIVMCILAGLLTFILYSPVIFFGTGAGSIFANEIVEPGDWTFVENLRPRAERTWFTWNQGIPLPVQYIILSGFLLSLVFHKKINQQRLPLQVFMVIVILILLPIQRIAPFARVWLYLEFFYMIFAAGALTWLAFILIKTIVEPRKAERIVSLLTVLIVMISFVITYGTSKQPDVIADKVVLPEQRGAEYLALNLKPEDTILSIAPTDIRTAYYLYMSGIPYGVFYQRDHPVDVKNAIIVLRTNSEYNTPESVLDFYKLTSGFDLQNAELVYNYGVLDIYSVPSR